MNEMNLLREYGPDAPATTDEVLRTARDRLRAEMSTGRRRRAWSGMAARPARRRALVLGAAAAALTAVAAVGLLPSGGDPGPAGGPVTLVSFASPVFPVALDPVPAGLRPGGFTGEQNWLAMSYESKRGDDRVLLLVSSVAPADVPGMRRTTVDGRPARLETPDMDGGPPIVNLHWQRSARQWVLLTGEGRFASEDALRAVAATVVDRPQEIPLRVGLAPAGWTLRGFKDDVILTLHDPGSEREMTVQLVDRAEPDLRHSVMGAREVTEVRVHGRPAQLVRADELWFLQASVPGGAIFTLQAPLDFTPEQVIAVGEQVTVRR
ncbi:hypothetical protein [Micromonospora auratinigra]|uniref:Uncharacterized protein n=1 Tax=Micromonospora auratinigra TaxID=261654 RepID=A0A1A9AAP4_9ACTN|nr:hypothetical protein [Micromonospora auratinigra]SBT53557.1 hypothetical protein GA0070611_6184 [Micromonospora auratinigra]